MKLRYVGPKPVILHNGIEFDKNKEDKYIYLHIAVELLKALEHDYHEDKPNFYDADTHDISDDDLKKEVHKHCHHIHQIVEQKKHDTELKIEEDILRARQNKLLAPEDREVLQNNIKIMSDCIIQRAVNKSVYYCIIEEIAKRLLENNIKYIVMPFNQKFAHIFHSIQGSLFHLSPRTDSKITVYVKEKELYIKLDITQK